MTICASCPRRAWHANECEDCKNLFCTKCWPKGYNDRCAECTGPCASCDRVADPDNECVKCQAWSCRVCWPKGYDDCCISCTKHSSPKKYGARRRYRR